MVLDPAELATLSGIGATALSAQLTGKMGLGGNQSLTSNLTMVSNLNNYTFYDQCYTYRNSQTLWYWKHSSQYTTLH